MKGTTFTMYNPKHAVARVVKSLSPRGRTAAVVAALAIAGGGYAALATGASASNKPNTETHACDHVTFCGSQALRSLGLAMSVTNHPGVGTAVQVLNNSTTNGKEDFYQFNPPGTSGDPHNWKSFEYAPHGAPFTPASAPDGLCVTLSNDSTGSPLVLQDCSYSNNQEFTATPSSVASGYTWRVRGQSWLITDPHDGGQYTHLVIANATTDFGAGQAFTYDG